MVWESSCIRIHNHGEYLIVVLAEVLSHGDFAAHPTGFHLIEGPTTLELDFKQNPGTSALSTIENLTTDVIASAVEAKRPFRGLFCRMFFVTRRAAFAWFVFTYLLYVGADILWNLPIAVCVLLVEIITNRFTMKIYSTFEIVDLVMRRTTITLDRSTIWMQGGIGTTVVAAGFVLRWLETANYVYHFFIFVGLSWIIIYLKTLDHVRNPDTGAFCFINSGRQEYVIKVEEYPGTPVSGLRPNPSLVDRLFMTLGVYPGLLFVLVLPFLLYISGGVEEANDKPYAVICLSIVLPWMGCVLDEPWKFGLVRDSIEHMRNCKLENF